MGVLSDLLPIPSVHFVSDSGLLAGHSKQSAFAPGFAGLRKDPRDHPFQRIIHDPLSKNGGHATLFLMCVFYLAPDQNPIR